jgi:hypothetical protein
MGARSGKLMRRLTGTYISVSISNEGVQHEQTFFSEQKLFLPDGHDSRLHGTASGHGGGLQDRAGFARRR